MNTPHLQHIAALLSWSRARDVLAGEDAVKAAGEHYLPRLALQTDAEYDAYRQRAVFFNATARTADGFCGLIFRRPPFVKLPPPATYAGKALAALANDADLRGTTLPNYAKDIVTEVLAVGRAGTLIDWEGEPEARPYFVRFTAEQILNWRVHRIQGRNVLTRLVLREHVLPADLDPGEPAPPTREQLRVLKLVPAARLPGHTLTDPDTHPFACLIELYQQTTAHPTASPYPPEPDDPEPLDVDMSDLLPHAAGDPTAWTLVDVRIPLRLGRALPSIPFVFHGPRHARPDVDKLPLGDLIAVNLDHYRLDADYKHGMHYTALPTAWVSGFDKSATLQIGSSTAWVTDKPNASAGFLEFKGHGLTTFERALDRDERLMALLGSRLLEPQKRVGESAETIELRQSGEDSVLASLAASVSASLTQALRWAYWWHSTETLPEQVTREQVALELNTDFSTRGLTAAELEALVASWQAKAFSRDTLLDLLRKGEIIPDSRTNEEETRLINNQTSIPKPQP